MKRIGLVLVLLSLVLMGLPVSAAIPATVRTSPATPPEAAAASPLATLALDPGDGDRGDYFLDNLLGSKPAATDSASAATALSTGHKTDDGNLAWLPGDPAGGGLETIAEYLRNARGFAIGVASTVQFSHATPAGFVSHNVSRNNYSAIATEILSIVQPEVVIGGGNPDFNGGNYSYVGGTTLWADLNAGATAYTHVVTRTAGADGGDALIAAAATVDLASGNKLAAVFGGAGSNFDYHVPSDSPGSPSFVQGSTQNPLLADVVTATLNVLDQDPQGFFVMFEQGDIDWSNHANDFASMVGGVWDLDEAVKTAEAFVDSSPDMDWTNTLVIVTSDHSNSYMRLPKPLGMGDLPQQVGMPASSGYSSGWDYPDGDVTYQSTQHTNELVTVWTHGQASYLFDDYTGLNSWYPAANSRIVDNSQIYDVMMRAVAEAGAEHVILFIGDGMNIGHEIAASRYLYGEDLGLSWHRWGQLTNGWAGFASTWDVTAYNAYAAEMNAPAYDSAAFNPSVGYDPAQGGWAPFPLLTDNTVMDVERNAYFLNPLGSGYGAQPATDSASAATAMSTGLKTDDGNMAWETGDPADGSLVTIAEYVRAARGFAIGVASTVQFSHATPAGFVSHNVSRNNYSAIATEILSTVQPEVVIGGGHPGFNGGNYSYVGGSTLWTSLNTGGTGYTQVVTRTAGVDGGAALIAAAGAVNLTGGDKLAGVFGGAGNNFEYHIPSDTPGSPGFVQGSAENPLLADVVTATLSVLDQDPQGFFVVFEQGDIDWSNHANDFASMVGGVWDLEGAVLAAQDYVDGAADMDWNNTLVIVTSDHSNSYMRLRKPLGEGDLPQQVSGSPFPSYPDGEIAYATGGHTNELVTLWAMGAGADLFDQYANGTAGDYDYDDPNGKIVDNTAIYQVMKRAVQSSGAKHVILFIGDGMNIEHEIAASRYLYGTDLGLSWHQWASEPNAWTGYCATWDVTTYNRYAAALGAPAFDPDTLSNNNPTIGYNPEIGGYAPYRLEADHAQSWGTARDDYFLENLLGSKPAATDSASAATAMSAGAKTDDGNVAWETGDPVGGDLITIAEWVRSDLAWSIGVASTVQFSHATPAAFVSHNVSRNNYSAIATEILTAVEPEVVIGGGHPGFNGGNYSYVGGSTLWTSLNTGGTGYTQVVTRTAGVDGGAALIAAAGAVNLTAGDKLVGVFGGAGNNFEYHVPSDTPGGPTFVQGSTENPLLADVVTATLSVLNQDPQGFFVMFEQGDIDWSNHANDFSSMVGGVWDLDEAVKTVESFVDNAPDLDWDNTLVIVTSDHANSYMRLHEWLGKGDLPLQNYVAGGSGDYSSDWEYADGEVTYGTTQHTNELVTLAARGAAATLFEQAAGLWYGDTHIVDNTQIYEVMRRAAGEMGVEHIILFIGDGMNVEHEIAGSRYLYGVDRGLAWHNWDLLDQGWAGYVATWDVSAYNAYAADMNKPFFSAASFDPKVGYSTLRGGYAPFPLQSDQRPELTLSKSLVSVAVPMHSTTAATLTVTNTGLGILDWAITESADWLVASPVSGNTSAEMVAGMPTTYVKGSDDTVLTFDTTGMEPGYYKTTMKVLSDDPTQVSVDVAVVLRVIAPTVIPAPTNAVTLTVTGRYVTGLEGASEIAAFHPGTDQVYVTNGANKALDILDVSNPSAPTLVTSIDITPYGASLQSVAVCDELVAVAIQANVKTDNGSVLFLEPDGTYISAVGVGALPDMVTFSSDCSKLFVANEGEPNDDYSVDPEGSVSIVDLTGGAAAAAVTTLGFDHFDQASLDPRIRIYGPGATVAQDLEPEYIALSSDGDTAWVTLQENNAMAIVDVQAMTVTQLIPLGYKDYSGYAGLDPSDKDGGTNITNWPVMGMYQPDAIAAYQTLGGTFLVTANEGDSRDYAGYSEESRVKDETLDTGALPNAAELQADAVLGRLKVTTAVNSLTAGYDVDPDNDGDVDVIYSFGARSFSIWNAAGEQVFDSGDALEQITADQAPTLFNANSGDPLQVDTRSDDKGPEAESVVLGAFDGHTLAFIGLERGPGGVVIYDITNPSHPIFLRYVPSAAGDISPEGLVLVSAADSPSGKPLLVVANELTGSTTIYEIEVGSLPTVFYRVMLPLVAR